MRWQGRRESSNVEDRRGQGGGFSTGGLSGIPLGRGGISLGGFLAILLISWALGIDPATLFNGVSVDDQAPQTLPSGADSDEMKDFVSVVLADTEDTWKIIFSQLGREYREPHLVLFSGAVNSACGMASSAVGPFYCPADEKVYIDLSFYDELKTRFGAPGDFAQAYVIAHEVGHHVQKLLGITDEVAQMRRGLSTTAANALSVRVELQADCLAGIWANHAEKTRDLVEKGDIEEAIAAATAIGDDTLQRESGGQVMPDTFTHGTSAQRVKWFKVGLENGTPSLCDTLSAKSL